MREVDGHDMLAVEEALTQVPYETGRPSCIIARTIKGKGVSYMETKLLWHYRAPLGEDLTKALAELRAMQMRNSFLKELFELAKKDDRIVLIVGDLGFGVVTPFMEQLPRQFLNAGVAEQNMTGMAAGMALSGKIAFTYSIANFPTMRCLEHIRNDVCYHNANVKIVTVGGGFAYGAMGATHHAIEDLAVMRALPGMVVVAPGDPVESRAATRAITEYFGPCYLRLGKAGEPVAHQTEIPFELGKSSACERGGT